MERDWCLWVIIPGYGGMKHLFMLRAASQLTARMEEGLIGKPMLIAYCLGPETCVAMARALKTSLREEFRRLHCLSVTGSPASKELWSRNARAISIADSNFPANLACSFAGLGADRQALDHTPQDGGDES